MLPEKPSPGSAADWLRHARSDLGLACAPLPPDVLYNELCFHAQQAVEKSIKAVLLEHGIEPPRVHGIAYLLELLPPGVSSPPEAVEAVGLSIYAVIARYPGDYEEVTEGMYQEAIRVARVIFAWAERIVG